MSKIVLKMYMSLRTIWQQFCLMFGNQSSLTGYFFPVIQLIKKAYHPNLLRCVVKEKLTSANNMVTLTLAVPKKWGSFVPGQHVLLTINRNGKYMTRAFSICSARSLLDERGLIQVSCKVSALGEFTPHLERLKVNDKLNLSAAQGHFHLDSNQSSVVMIAAGSGITPMRSFIQSTTQNRNSPAYHFSLVYRFKGLTNATFHEEFSQLCKEEQSFHYIPSDSTQSDKDSLASIVEESVKTHSYDGQTAASFYLCGPDQFMQEIRTSLLNLGVSEACIHQEAFSTTRSAQVKTVDNSQSFLTSIKKAGNIFTASSRADQTLLDVAEDSGAEPGFGCRMGVCYQCVCTKVSGQVMDIRDGKLGPLGKQQIQLCVSAPVTDIELEY